MHSAKDPMVVRTRMLFPWDGSCGTERPRGGRLMSGTILCGVDDSQSARDALQLAAALSERLRVRLVVAHVASRKSAQEAERSVSRWVAEAASSAQADVRVAVGDRAARLAQIAAEEG